MRYLPCSLLLLISLTASCRTPARMLPTASPDFTGRIVSQSFASNAGGPAGLARIEVNALSSGESPSAYVRVDSTTVFANATSATIRWDLAGITELRDARVRIWFAGAPTSTTAREVWATARLIVLDSLGRSR